VFACSGDFSALAIRAGLAGAVTLEGEMGRADRIDGAADGVVVAKNKAAEVVDLRMESDGAGLMST